MTGHVPRRSERSHKQSSEQSVSRGRSRNGSNSRSTSQRRCVRSIPNVDKSPPRKRKRSPSFPVEEPNVFTRIVDRRTVDRFCWLCHKECDSESICDFCPRSYHDGCLKKMKGNCECQLKLVGGQSNFLNLGPDNLRKCLQFVVQQSIKEDKKNNQKSQAVNSLFCRLFQTWPPEKNKLCKIMDLDILIDNMNSEEPYKSTGEFFVDLKWMHHNCYILYGPNHSITEAAFKMEKNFKQELIDMEACPECYFVKYSYLLNFFTRVCKKPHMIVWAKLRGSPFWPAKCLKISNGHADVRFFGTHDKSNIPINKCYKISKENPLKNVHQAKYMDAVNELKTYVKNYENSHGQFRYYPQKTSLEDSNSSAKKSNKKGHHRLNDTEPANQNSDPKELKFRASVENFEDENITDPEGVDSDPHVVCHMTFIADEHNEPDCELNNSEDIMRFSTSPCSLPVPSLDPNLASFEQTPSLLSTGIIAASSEMELPPESQNSLNFLVNNLPVITSVTTNEMALNELPVNTSPVISNDISANEVSTNPSGSNSLPFITSTVSASEREIFACNNIFAQENNETLPVNDLHSEAPLSVPPFNRMCSSLTRDLAFNCLLGNDVEMDDDIQIVGEEKKTSIAEDILKSEPIIKAMTDILIGNRPYLKKIASNLQNVIMQYIVIMILESSFTKFDQRDVKGFTDKFKKLVGKVSDLKNSLETARNEKDNAEKSKQEADKRKELAEIQLREALIANRKLENELKELKKRVEMLQSGELQNHRAELKETIIKKAAEKLHSNNRISDIEFLKQQLNDAKEKLNIKEANICILKKKSSTLVLDLERAKENILILTEENEKLKSDLSYVDGKSKPNMSHFGVQTEETHPEFFEREVQVPDSPDFNENQDSSQLNQDFHENPDDPNISDRTVSQQIAMRQTYIYETVESDSDSDSRVLQQVYEQNVSECASVMTASTTGMMSAGPPIGMMSAAAPTLVQVPVVVPAGAFISAPGPYILDAQSSATFLNSMNSPPAPPSPEPIPPKPKAKSSSVVKYGGKRRKKNV